jgi:hypothetical protein
MEKNRSMFACHPANFSARNSRLYKISFYFALFIFSVKQKAHFFLNLLELGREQNIKICCKFFEYLLCNLKEISNLLWAQLVAKNDFRKSPLHGIMVRNF